MDSLPKLPIAVAACVLALSGCGDAGVFLDVSENDGVEADRRTQGRSVWIQHGGNDAICVHVKYASSHDVLSRQACEDRARAKGHMFYSYFENIKRKRCSTSNECKESMLSKNHPGWKSYRHSLIWPEFREQSNPDERPGRKCKKVKGEIWHAAGPEACQKAVVAKGLHSYMFRESTAGPVDVLDNCAACKEVDNEPILVGVRDPYWAVYKAQDEEHSAKKPSGETCSSFLDQAFGGVCHDKEFFSPDSELLDDVVPEMVVDNLDWQYCCKPQTGTCATVLGACPNDADKGLFTKESASFSLSEDVPSDLLMSRPQVVNYCCDNTNEEDAFVWLCDSGAGQQRGMLVNGDPDNILPTLQRCKDQCKKKRCGLLQYHTITGRCQTFMGWEVSHDKCGHQTKQQTWYNPQRVLPRRR